jgi:hypothetical protein
MYACLFIEGKREEKRKIFPTTYSFFQLLLLNLWLYEWQELDNLLWSSQGN